MTTLYVDGENQGDGVCVRQPSDPAKATYPISPLSNDAIACGYNGETAVSRICPASQNSTLTFQFREWPDASNPGSIDSGHKGPCAVYMKPVEDASSSNNAAGGGWFKIYELDYDENTAEWCTEKMIANNGFMSVAIPEGLKGGDYLVRTELLALHAAVESPPDPQFYVSCAQVFLAGNENGDTPEGVVIDGSTYSTDMEGLTYNIYEEPLQLPYPRFGPDVYQPSSSSATAKTTSGTQVKQSKGLEPEGCILIRDNWCGKEVPSYSDEEGCWASSKQCWTQADSCWDGAPPTGGQNCEIWSDKCNNIDDQCNAGNFQGPPNKGKVLTPESEYSRVDGSMEVFSGGVSSSDYEAGGASGSGDGTGEGAGSVVAPASTVVTTSATATASGSTASPVTETDVEATSGRRPKGHGRGRCKAKRSHRA
ncbi:lytic polysaccharide monooxygenase auxiliary activity family 9 protein [Aspergillus undulatus]|uniref:lytic polysaccharide monooxygenase auxiliary activity family 9 protein n=1 Tax=Aspergillus undulatus TaxID=1810928 RepID=UPI003CCC9294